MIIQCWPNKPLRSPGHSTCMHDNSQVQLHGLNSKYNFHIEQQALARLQVLHMYVGSPKSHD